MNSILFTPDLQTAVRNGRKTQTRRPIDAVPTNAKFTGYILESSNKEHKNTFQFNDGTDNLYIKPKYQPGEVIYLREAFRVHSMLNELSPKCIEAGPVEYRTGGTLNSIGDTILSPGRWRSPLHLPEKLARTFVRIKEVRVEKLKDISNRDAIKEGINKTSFPIQGTVYPCYIKSESYYRNPVFAFHSLWQSIYGFEALESNPWVLVYEFELCNKKGGKLADSH